MTGGTENLIRTALIFFTVVHVFGGKSSLQNPEIQDKHEKNYPGYGSLHVHGFPVQIRGVFLVLL